jgi:hypothetical protein
LGLRQANPQRQTNSNSLFRIAEEDAAAVTKSETRNPDFGFADAHFTEIVEEPERPHIAPKHRGSSVLPF